MIVSDTRRALSKNLPSRSPFLKTGEQEAPLLSALIPEETSMKSIPFFSSSLHTHNISSGVLESETRSLKESFKAIG